MRRTAPLFQIDPGWLFTIAGLAIMVSAALLPAELDLHDLRQQRAAIAARESWNRERLEAYDRFLGELDRRDPALLRRLAASQLNLMPKGEQPLLMATSIEHTVSDWIEATVPPMEFQPQPAPDTLLARLAEGQRRLWLMAGGAMSVFLGLVLGFGVSARPQLERFEPLPFPLPSIDAAALEEPLDSESSAETRETPDQAEELAAEAFDVEDPLATAEAVAEESFEWPDPEPAFEPAEADSFALHDGTPETPRADASTDADDAWLRDHGSD
ncbi:MAG: hypothetical protein ACOYMI_04690 [Phycisphaerales bacterium]